MKNAVLLIALSCALCISSCKKCVTCSNVCYTCTNGVINLCNTDSQTPAQFDAILADIRSSGATCTQVQSTKSEKICDKPAAVKNFENYYESSNYQCK